MLSARRTLTLLVTALVSVAAAGLAGAPAAQATHDEDCRAYSNPKAPQDEVGVGAAVITADGITAQLDLAAEVLEEGKPATAAAHKVAAGIAGASVTVEYGIKTALFVLQRINAEADECRIDAHYRLLDDILNSQIRRDLALRGTPVAMFVLPEEFGGYLDSPGVGTRAVVEDAIKRMKARGQCTCSAAQNTYDQAVAAMDSGSYKAAYKLFRQAYVYAFSN
jgi:hypothetical protein